MNGSKEGRSYNDNGKAVIEIECDMGSIDIKY